MGKRLGAELPKAFITLGNKPLYIHSLEVFGRYPQVSEIIMVVPGSWVKKVEQTTKKLLLKKPVHVVAGGQERWQSVRNGLRASKKDPEWFLIHDAARPFVTDKVIDAVLQKADSFQCVITAIPVTDTIRTFDDDQCTGTVDRSSLLRVGTPQLFNRQVLHQAFSSVEKLDQHPSDEAVLVEKSGLAIGYAWGDPNNFKITTPGDWELAQALYSYRQQQKSD